MERPDRYGQRPRFCHSMTPRRDFSYFCGMETTSLPLERILTAFKIDALNEMQLASLEANKTSDAVMLLADTGSGKTLGFLLPIWELLDSNKAFTQALIITPSRELALQIEQVFKKMGTGFKITC